MHTTFDQLLKDTARFDAKMSSPIQHYASQRAPYLATARLIARRVLMQAIPSDHSSSSELSSRWKSRVEVTIDRIMAELLLGGWGMILTISSPPPGDGLLDSKETRPQMQQVNHTDVVEWIRAGKSGLEGGKRITARDQSVLSNPHQGINSLATIVMRAYYSRRNPPNYLRLRRAIQRYLSGALDQATGNPLLDAVAAAWVEHFSVRFPRDLGAYVSKLVSSF